MLIADAAFSDEHVCGVLDSVFCVVPGRRLVVLDRAPAHAPAGPRLRRLQLLRDLTRAAQATLLVKERADLALAVGADGLHLGERAMTAADARRFGLPLGRACHDRAGLLGSAADWALLSPVAAPLSKPRTSPPLTVDGFREATAGLGLPVYALGGIEPALAAPLRRAGAAGLAVIGAVFLAASPGLAAAELVGAWDG